jgi:hypothetical protein
LNVSPKPTTRLSTPASKSATGIVPGPLVVPLSTLMAMTFADALSAMNEARLPSC